jgi:uncharacterized damage-inducible protein DinB
MHESPKLAPHVLDTCVAVLEGQQRLADRAIAQLSPEQMAHSPGADLNSVQILMKHLAGNMRSLWSDFLMTEGEKPSRRRDAEFEDEDGDAASVQRSWQHGWQALFAALDALTPDDPQRQVTIRGQPLSVLEAVLRQVSHYAYHVGQIVLLARLQVGEDWTTLSIPRGSAASPAATSEPGRHAARALRSMLDSTGTDQ